MFYSKFNFINILKNFLLIISLVLFCTVLIYEPRSVTKNDALIHCEITNILTFNNLDPYLEENIEKVYPKIFSIYNPNHFEVNKVIFKENDVNLKTSNFLTFIEQLLKQRKKISFNGLNLKIVEDDKLIVKLENIFFSNFGYKKNSIEGKVFNKKFEAKLDDNLEFIEFKLLNSGLISNLELNKKTKTGTFKSKILR